MGEPNAIARFWAWWPALAKRLSGATETVKLAEIDELVRHVEDIHPKIRLLGAYRPGGKSWLCLSSRGNLAVRPIVEEWARGAPPTTDWQFLAARPPSWPPRRPTPFSYEEITTRCATDDLCEVIHVTLYHPDLAALEPVHQDTVAFVVLDDLLGENAVERWIGNVEVSDAPLEDALPILTLRERVKTLAENATGMQWQAVRAGGKERPLLVSINRALKPIDHIRLHLHVRIDLKLQSPSKYGLAHGKEELELEKLQKELTSTLGTRAVAIARETHQGHRIIHVHANESAAPLINTWRQKYPQWTIEVLTQDDPHWEILRRWGDPGTEIRASAFPPKRASSPPS